MPSDTAATHSPYPGMSTDALWVTRTRLIDGMERIGLLHTEGGLQGERLGAAVVTIHIQANQVGHVDAELLRRGEKVPQPFWLK